MVGALLAREPESPVELASSRCRRVVTVNSRERCDPRPTVAASVEVCDGGRGIAIEPARGDSGAAERTLKHETGLDAERLQPARSRLAGSDGKHRGKRCRIGQSSNPTRMKRSKHVMLTVADGKYRLANAVCGLHDEEPQGAVGGQPIEQLDREARQIHGQTLRPGRTAGRADM